MTSPTDRPAGPGPAAEPVEAVRAVLEDLGPVDPDGARPRQEPGQEPDQQPDPEDGAGPAQPTDRLERVDEAHRRLRRLLEVPDA